MQTKRDKRAAKSQLLMCDITDFVPSSRLKDRFHDRQKRFPALEKAAFGGLERILRIPMSKAFHGKPATSFCRVPIQVFGKE